MSKAIRVGAGQGFYGDDPWFALQSAKYGNVDYMGFDSLAELTLAILEKARQKNPDKGYAADIITYANLLLPFVKERGLSLVTNAGGLNPHAAAKAVARLAKEIDFDNLKIATITGDDIKGKIKQLRQAGLKFENLDTGEPMPEEILNNIIFANCYLGALPVKDALDGNADIVVAGRITDPALFAGPILSGMNWQTDNLDQVAFATLLGHLLECGGQITGGNFSGDWESIPNLERLGYPIAEVYDDLTAVITKPDGTGGMVSVDTVKEQMLYEIHDPSNYIGPDCVVDITSAILTDIGKNRVKIAGVRGKRPPATLKALFAYPDGYIAEGRILYGVPNALRKAKAMAEIMKKRLEILGIKPIAFESEFIGGGALKRKEPDYEPDEILLRVAVKVASKNEAQQVTKLFPAYILDGPPGADFFGAPPKPRQAIGIWSALIDRELIERYVKVNVKTAKEILEA